MTSVSKTSAVGDKVSAQATGLLFSRLALIMGSGLLLGAVWLQQPALVALISVCLSVGLTSQLWSRVCLTRVTCKRQASESRLFPGDSLDLRTRLENRKLLPLPWIEVEERFPSGLEIDSGLHGGGLGSGGGGDDPVRGESGSVRSAAVSWYSAVSWTKHARAVRRGYYPLPPLRISSGDIFGLCRRTQESAPGEPILVYPALRDPSDPSLPSLDPVGDSTSLNRAFEDPSRTLGIRDYSPGDSLRRIHWKATARRAELQVRVFEPTTTLKAALFLVADSFFAAAPAGDDAAVGAGAGADPGREAGSDEMDRDAAGRDEVYEAAISVTASMARDLVAKNAQVGLWCNARQADTGQPLGIAAGSGLAQLTAVLEALAKATESAALPFATFFEAERSVLSFGTTPVFVVGSVPAHLRDVLVDLSQRGYRSLVVLMRNESYEPVPGVSWHLPCANEA